MTYLKHTLCQLLGVLIGVAVLASCSLDEPVQEQIETYTLSFQLTTNGVFSRAEEVIPWLPEQETDEDGAPFDRTISTIDLFLLGEGNSLTRLYAVEAPGEQQVFTCKVTNKTQGVAVDKETGNVFFTGKIMALANVENLIPAWITAEGRCRDEELSYDMKFGADDYWHIPMWGVKSCEKIPLFSDETNKIGQIYMLRAVSKIIIKLDESIIDDYKIEKISMPIDSPKMSKQGYTLPQNALSVYSTEFLDRETCFYPYRTAEKIDKPVFKGSDFQKYTYVSESETKLSEPYKFIVTLKSLNEGRPDIAGIVYFSNYNEDLEHETTITNVVRNHIYEFTINIFELQFLTTVKKWEWGGHAHIEF